MTLIRYIRVSLYRGWEKNGRREIGACEFVPYIEIWQEFVISGFYWSMKYDFLDSPTRRSNLIGPASAVILWRHGIFRRAKREKKRFHENHFWFRRMEAQISLKNVMKDNKIALVIKLKIQSRLSEDLFCSEASAYWTHSVGIHCFQPFLVCRSREFRPQISEFSAFFALALRHLTMLLGNQSSNRNVVDVFFDFLQIILERVEAFAQCVVLQVQKAESGVQLAHETPDSDWSREVLWRHGVDR